MVAFKDKIHFEFLFGDVEKLRANAGSPPFVIIAFGHNLRERKPALPSDSS